MDLTTITAKTFYSGYDPGTEKSFTLEEGESAEVSDEKLAQLERDGLLERFDVEKGSRKGSRSRRSQGAED